MPVAVTAIMMALAVGGCSGTDEDSEPTVEAAPSVGATPGEDAAPTLTLRDAVTPEPSPEPSSSPAPTLRPVPPEAMELSEAGALAFLEWWVDMYNYVEATGETELVFQHSEPGCTFCRNFVDRVDPVYQSGGRIERNRMTEFTDVSSEGLVEDYVVVTVTLTGGAGTTYGSNGEIIRESPATTPFRGVIGLQWASNSWNLVDIGVDEAAS